MTDNLRERLRDIYANDDHARGCEGRTYSCSCGFDDRTFQTAEEAAAEITRLQQALAAAETREAKIDVHRKRILLGLFPKLEDAIAARRAAEIRFGFFPNHGAPRHAQKDKA